MGRPRNIQPRVTYSTYPLAIESALRGDGVVLGSRNLIAHHLLNGELVELSPEAHHTGYGYYLGLSRLRPPSTAALQLYRWLLAQSPALGGAS